VIQADGIPDGVAEWFPALVRDASRDRASGQSPWLQQIDSLIVSVEAIQKCRSTHAVTPKVTPSGKINHVGGYAVAVSISAKKGLPSAV
jgi:hypothetical protein